MKVFILLSLVAGAFAFLDCPANQHYESCGTACPLTCENYNDPPIACVLMCNPGCHCDEGYVKTKNGECVKPESCPSEEVCSGENQRYNECGTACPLTCDNYKNPPKICTLQCVIGCECKEGYVKDIQGRCVLPENCPAVSLSANVCELPSETGMCRGYFPRYHFNKASGQCEEFIYGGCGGNENNFATLEECHNTCAASSNGVCGENEEYVTCGTACPLTCDNLHDPPRVCTMQCIIGCQCQSGYVKNAQGKCVLPEQCPSRAVCGENQKFTECGTACPLTCDNYQNPPKFCTKQCVIGCQCENGYVKNAEGECVLPEECSSRALSANLCELPSETGRCKGYFPRYHFNQASGQCEKFIYGGCGGNENNFHTLEECHNTCAASSNNVCGVNEEYVTCGTACPLTCDNRHDPARVCTLQCVIGCQCQRGYVKNSQGKCVLPEQCPSRAVCGENEKFTTCGTACPLTCDNYQNPPKFCTLQCIFGCQCQKGYVRSDNGCVLPEQCASVQSALDRPDCDKGPEVGNCRARMPRYYYDQEEGMCKKFIYGGCGGNRNNFATRDECLNKCGALAAPKNALCEQEKVVGPCRAAFRRHFFNQLTGQCEPFIYGGCGGNGNNFHSKDDCEATCVA